MFPVLPRMRVGVQATLGVDSVVGGISNLVLNQLATLGYDSILACLPGARSAKQKVDVAQQPDRSLFGAVLHSNSIASSIGEKEFHRLVGLRDSRGAVEGYASRLYVDLLCGHIVSIFFARRVLRALQIELHLTAANDILSVSFVLAAMRVYEVVTVAGLTKNGDLDVLQEACRILLEVRRLRGFHGKELLGSHFLGKCQPALLTRDTLRRRRGGLFLFSMRHPFSVQIHARREHRQQASHSCRPARVSGRFTSLHAFS